MRTKNAFLKDFWVFDTIAGIVFGFCIGYVTEGIANSDEYNLDKMLFRGFFLSFCCVLAAVLGLRLKDKFQQIPSWIWISVLGGVIFILLAQIIAFANDQYYFNRVSLSEYVANRVSGDITFLFASSLFYSLLLFVPLFCARTIVFVITELKTLLLTPRN